MSKKANLVSLRKKVTPSLKLIQNSNKLFIKQLTFLKIFIYFLQKKGIWVLQSYIYSNKIFCKLYLTVLLSLKKIKIYKKKIIKKKQLNQYLPLKKLTNLFLHYIKNLNYLLIIKNYNKQNKDQYANLKSLYFQTSHYKNTLFQRRLHLYFDLLKIFNLLYNKKIHVSCFLHLLALTFKYLSKKLHSKFLRFIEILVYNLIYNETKKDYRNKGEGILTGLKFRINGKLKGKMRTSSYLINYGKVPNQSIDNTIEYSKVHTYTRYGAFGLHIWLYK